MKLEKLKFFKISTSLSITEIVKKMNMSSYTNDNKVGLEIYSYSNERIYAKYIEQVISYEIVVDPLGKEEEIRTIRYIVFDFEIIFFKNNVFLKIVSPPKGLKIFFDLFGKLSKRNFFKEMIKVDIKSFYLNLLVLKRLANFTVPKVLITAIPFSKSATAKFEITSIDNAYKEFEMNTKYVNYKIEKLKMNFRFNGELCSMEINHTGLLNVSDKFINTAEYLIYSQFIK